VNIELRAVTDADRDFLEALYAESRADELALTNFTDAEKAAFCAQQLDAQNRSYSQRFPDASYDIVLVDDAPAGRLIVHRGEAFQLVDILMAKRARGAGIGTQLLRGLVDEADRAGCDITLTVEATNPARRLYERFGFVHEHGSDEWFLPYRRVAQANTAS